LKKAKYEPKVPEPLDEASVLQVVRAMKQIVKKSSSRAALERVLAKSETLDSLISSTPLLANDPVALSILQDKEMLILATIGDKDAMKRVLSVHPSLGHALLDLVSEVTAESVRAASDGTQSGSTPSNPRLMYGLDHMSDEDDDEEDASPMQQPGVLPPLGSAPGGQITPDFFRQAIQMVYAGGSSDQPQAQAPPASVQVSEAQLQQLRDMGIVDEALARQALEVTGGDIQLALEYYFSDGML
jgi:uncharacterized protein YjgD (DUF1641 family)